VPAAPGLLDREDDMSKERWISAGLTAGLLLAAGSAHAQEARRDALPDNRLQVPARAPRAPSLGLDRLHTIAPVHGMGADDQRPVRHQAPAAGRPRMRPAENDQPCGNVQDPVGIADLAISPGRLALVNLAETSVTIRLTIDRDNRIVVLQPRELNVFEVQNARLVQADYRINGVMATSSFAAGKVYRMDLDGSRWAFLGR
jgi:hypothetical protein